MIKRPHAAQTKATRKHFAVALALATAGWVVGLCAPAASAQLQAQNVLVVYDSRIADSIAVAEYYAGSAAVSGGAGNLAGTRPGVRVFDLQTAGTTAFTATTIERAPFNAQLRNPLRTWLAANDSAGRIRVITLTKGLPHRVENVGNVGVGDNPGQFGAVYNAGNINCASVDSELSLLWQNLDTSETGGGGDSKADGWILNPYWKQSLPITSWRTVNRAVTKILTVPISAFALGTGEAWGANVANARLPGAATQLTPGDIYLVCRIDGNTVAQVRQMLDRAANAAAGPRAGVSVNINTAGFVLDESASNGIADPSPNNGEYDNYGYDIIWNGDDYEQARALLTIDNRFLAANVKYDSLSNAANFIVGSLVSFAGQGRIIETPAAPLPLLLLSSYGANHAGPAPGEGIAGSPICRTSYASSFTYAPGAVFNTMESYNGRGFGGIGTGGVAQQQLSDFLAAGGTFGIGNVYEPSTLTVGDSALIVRNFHLGNLTWAEAAYTALPVLSFQQIVVGDPLARFARSTEDRDGDAMLTVNDLYLWNASPADINRSGGAGDETDRRFVQDAVRADRGVDMRGTQR